MSKKISNRLLEKSLSAALLGIELYNKPNIEYREEVNTHKNYIKNNF